MNQDKQPEALRLADDRPTYKSEDLYQWAIDAEDLIRRQHARIAELEAELVKEAARTADYKLRAEQFEQRLDMANKLGNEARAELAALKAAPSARAQDVQDTETLHLARVAVSESEGCSFPQDWMEAAIKVCKSVIAAAHKEK